MDVNSHPAREDHHPDPAESCDLWDGDDTFYAQIDLSRLVAESQGNADNNHEPGKHVAESGSKCPKSDGKTSVLSTETISSHQQFTDGDACAKYGNRGLENAVNVGEGMYVKSSIAQNAVDVQFGVESLQPVQSNTDSGDNIGAQIEQCGEDKVPKTPHQEKWFSKISEGSGNVQNLVVTKNVGSNDVASDAHIQSNNEEGVSNSNNPLHSVSKEGVSSMPKTPNMTTPVRQILDQGSTSAGSLLKRRLQSNQKAVTTPTSSHAHQLQRAAAVHEALAEMANLGSASSEKDIGPFYGLPRKVQELLAKHRGITQLYGKCSA